MLDSDLLLLSLATSQLCSGLLEVDTEDGTSLLNEAKPLLLGIPRAVQDCRSITRVEKAGGG